MQSNSAIRPMGGPVVTLGALCLAISGILFVGFPALRPFGDSSTDPVVIATTFASDAWVVSHSLAMIAFILMPIGLYGVYVSLQQGRVGRRAFQGFLLCWIGAALTLPFFGAEAFGLQAIGRQALAEGSSNVLATANAVRFGPGLGFIVVGLLLVAVGALLATWAVWGSDVLPRWSGVPFGIGLALYTPMLSVWASNQPIRIADALLIAAGSIWMAAALWRQGARGAR